MGIKYIVSSLMRSRNYKAPAGTLALWAGASAPTGWTFETALDDYFVQGADAADLTARGALTHVHTNPNTNTVSGHNNHSVIVPQISGWGSSSFQGTPGVSSYAGGLHTHDANAISDESTAGGHYHTRPNTNSASNLPKYRRLRWIKASAEIEIPIGAIVMHSSSATALGNNWKVCDGQYSTPDMRGYFVYSGSGADGGSDTHYHTNGKTNAAGSHSHTVHVKSGGVPTLVSNVQGSTSGQQCNKNHYHEADLTSSVAPDHQHDTGNTSTDTVLPSYIQLYFLQRIQ